MKHVFSEQVRRIGEIIPATVTQGNTWENDEECCGAANAADRDLSSAAIALTDNGAVWLKLEFGRTNFIHEIIIYSGFYTDYYDPIDDCAQSEKEFMACVDRRNNVDVSVYHGDVKQKSCGTLQLTYGLEQSDQIYTLLCNAEGDTVKLSKDAGEIIVYEVVTVTSGK